MASSPGLTRDLDNDSRVRFLKRIEPFSFYEITGPHNYVEIAENMPYRYKAGEWILEISDWYLNTGNLDKPVVYDDGSSGLEQFKEIGREQLGNVPKNPVNTGGEVISQQVGREKIEFTTTAVGVPHVIKI